MGYWMYNAENNQDVFPILMEENSRWFKPVE